MSALPSKHARTTGARATQTQKTMSIGVVLEKLNAEFPDVTVSKIRFLESEGLITPQRTSSGYRRFTQSDVDRLRYILVTQRDNYLPLKVIREQLDAMDSGAVTPLRRGDTEQLVSAESFKAPVVTRLTDSDIAEQANANADELAELIEAGIIKADTSGFFTADDVSVVSTALQLKDFGFDVRHLKFVRNAASRQADLISRATTPMARSKGDGKQRAEEMNQQMMALVVSLHGNMMKSILREEMK